MKKAVVATSTKTGSSTKETGASSSGGSTDTKASAEKNSAARLGSFGALAVALTVMGAMSF